MGRVAARIGVRGGADDDRLVNLHYRSLDGIGERAGGGGTHVHHHASLSRWDLQGWGDEMMGKEVETRIVRMTVRDLRCSGFRLEAEKK